MFLKSRIKLKSLKMNGVLILFLLWMLSIDFVPNKKMVENLALPDRANNIRKNNIQKVVSISISRYLLTMLDQTIGITILS